MFTELLPREESWQSSCEHCERRLERREGPKAPRYHQFVARGIAEALQAVGAGGSYMRASRVTRDRARRFRIDVVTAELRESDHGQLHLSLHPSATQGEYLAHETVCRLATEICGKLRIFACADEATEWHFTPKSRLEERVLLDLGRKVRLIVNEVLGDGIDLHVVWCDLDTNGLHEGKLGTARCAVGGTSFHSAQRRRTPHDHYLA